MRSDHAKTARYHLRRQSPTPGWLSLSWRALLALALIGVALAGHWFDRDGLRQNSGAPVTFADILYFTTITVTTVGYGDIVPVTQQARMFDTFVVTPIRLFVWLIFLGTAYDFLLKRVWEKWRMSVLQRRLDGHVIVTGYGTSGAEAVRELIARGADPAAIVVIDETAAALARAEACGATVMDGNATRNAALEAARIQTARAVIVSAGRDDTSILIVLTARRLAPNVPISVVIRSQDNEAIARQAGANTVINPASFAGLLLAGSIHGAHTAEYMADLAASGGRVALRERTVTHEEIGKPLSAITTGLGHRVYRGTHTFGFWEPETNRLEPGDLIVEVVQRP
ncbi:MULTISPECIES: potassium channel family protein [unclassified Sphingomonas]|uniref:potassium channel family protein n=1 Tax=unclassified Sphingomonas TaxID=196159 RepID=UPI000289ECB8|nr:MULTISPECIES: potassium channel family protein [unclassified Sphingomonas]